MTYTIYSGSNLDILPTLPDNSVDAIVTDPPYGLSDNKFVADTIAKWIQGERDFIPDGKGFMGKSWDAFVPPPALWDECLRVLKPGGHLLAFFGSRTQDIGALSIRLAGFEIRDSIAWMYGSGFPKSLDISKAIDKGTGENKQRQLKFVNWMRSTGLTAKEANAIVEKADTASHYFRLDQPAIATADLFDKLRPYLPEIPEEIERLVAERTGIEWKDYKNREVIGQRKFTRNTQSWESSGGMLAAGEKEIKETLPSTTDAQQWEGWGTALKPAFEPIVVARKPLIGTVAENVLTHGTGGLNIDGSRIGTNPGYKYRADANGTTFHGEQGERKKQTAKAKGSEVIESSKGRWPSNVILDPYTAELLDEQSGVTGGGKRTIGAAPRTNIGHKLSETSADRSEALVNYGDTGGASRFFYVAKASKRDRNEGLEDIEGKEIGAKGNGLARTCAICGASILNPCECPDRTFVNPTRQNFHPTVKPTDLMRYLVKLITPPGGVVLDPFTGSGSTGKAAILEGFDFIGIELTEEYLPIIEGRLKHAEELRLEEQAKKDEALF